MRQTLLSIFSLLFLLACTETNNSVQPDHIQFLDYSERYCTVRTPSGNKQSNYLSNWSLTNDTLKLSFLFESPCASYYSETVEIDGNELHISLTDTSESPTACSCTHLSYCTVRILSGENVKIDLDVRYRGQDNFSDCVDTLLVFR